VSLVAATAVDERRDLPLRRLRDAVAARYGAHPAALAPLDPFSAPCRNGD
jgi:hypothetical protein